MGEAAEEREVVAGRFLHGGERSSPHSPELPGQNQHLQQSSGVRGGLVTARENKANILAGKRRQNPR